MRIWVLVIGLVMIGLAYKTNDEYSIIVLIQGMILVNMAITSEKRKSLEHL